MVTFYLKKLSYFRVQSTVIPVNYKHIYLYKTVMEANASTIEKHFYIKIFIFT